MAKKKAPDRARARREFLALRPARNPIIGWDESEGRVLLVVPRPNTWKIRLINRFFEVPATRRVDLDALGSFVWKRCDGQTTIEKLSRELQREYKLGAREAELSLQHFFQTLGRRGYIGFVTSSE
ncbi:MAG TPA: PqqD family protein [Abditibacterium sp.]